MQFVIKQIQRSIIVLFFMLIFALAVYTKVDAASFKFNPSTKSFERTCQRSVSIDINPEGELSNAAEIEITYDPSVITIVDQNPNIAGIQIQPGNAFETYFYNEVNVTTGKIKLAGASFVTSLSSNKTFATITFTSSALATSTNFTIKFDYPGATKDSNIADAVTSNDLLSSVVNGSYTFINGPCQADTTSPQVVFQNPTNGATGVSLNSNVTLQITDDQSGIDLDSITFIIDGVSYTTLNPEVSYTGNSTNYNFVINPVNDFPVNQASTVVVTGKDIAGNTFSKQIIFNIPTPPPVTTDNEEPIIGFVNPVNLDSNVQVNEDIIITLGDNGSGVNLSTLIIYINGQPVTTSTQGVVVSGNPNLYTITIPGTGRIIANQVNFLRVVGSDFEGNSFDRQIVFNIPQAIQCPTDTDPNDPDAPDSVDDPITNTPEYQELLEDFKSNPDSLEKQIKNCYGQEIEINEVPTIVSEVLKSENLLKGTALENTVIDSIAKETSTSGFAALFAIILLSLNILPVLSLVAAAPGLGVKLLSILFGKSNTNPWGVITSAVDNKPVPFAVCQIFTQGSQFKVTQSISDLDGRYGFILSPGKYRLEIKQSGFKQFDLDIDIDEGQESVIRDVKLLPINQTGDYSENIFQQLFKVLLVVYKKISIFMFVFGYIFSIISMIIAPSFANFIIFSIFTTTILVYFLPILFKRSQFASIVDVETGLRIPFAQIKIFNSNTWQLIDSKVTNYNGLFDFYGEAGTYGIVVEARGYQFPSSKNKYPTAGKNRNNVLLVDLKKGKNNITIFLDPLKGNNLFKDNINSPFSG
ncbi:carboxypeptidase regulatory-like domain-containing protein [Candidatus Dojkabacteria bacterium]|uniref:Carboxypeptidase regulatory-like domain-containing protein n=1 Tax=Candidatus Dojkabacteria bacterium TaxID=2099670 RepID=A0A955LAU2_9BACT|nr:carboxypeptidase regulatory-like domain-containing protein [Candidatus Dojkabacteria bacterium]